MEQRSGQAALVVDQLAEGDLRKKSTDKMSVEQSDV